MCQRLAVRFAGVLSLEEWKAELEKLRRERENLNLSHTDLQTRLVWLREQASAGAVEPPPPEVEGLLRQLLALLELEREQVAGLWRLLEDSLTRMVEGVQDS
jgi:hypothetical protein